MKTLDKAAYDRAASYLESEARPLERALFGYYFGGASADEAQRELASFQNPDGGFGHGLEPDAQTPVSSALHTAIGLRTLKDLGCDADDQMVKRAVQYLVDTYDPQTKVWPIMPDAVNDAPHAPWWQVEGDSLEKGFNGFRLNPRAEIVGLLHHYSSLVSPEWLDEVTSDTVAAAEAGGDEWHDLINIATLADEFTLPENYRGRLAPRLSELARGQVKQTVAEWKEYGGQPLTLAPLHESLLAEELSDTLAKNLDFAIESQAENGAWEPNWSWFGLYPEEWEVAKRNWSGVLTLAMLRSLRSYGRLES